MARFPHRRVQGTETGMLDCTHCKSIKPVREFRPMKRGGWRSWCHDCIRQGMRDRYQRDGAKLIQVIVTAADVEYMLDQMVPDSVARNYTKCATWVIAEAIAAHKKQRTIDAMPRPTEDKKRLMAGR